MKPRKVVRGAIAGELLETSKYERCKFSDIVPLFCSSATEILPLKTGISAEWLLWGPFHELEKIQLQIYRFFSLCSSCCLICLFPVICRFQKDLSKGCRQCYREDSGADDGTAYVLDLTPSEPYVSGSNGHDTHTLVCPTVLSLCSWRGTETVMETLKSLSSAARGGE